MSLGTAITAIKDADSTLLGLVGSRFQRDRLEQGQIVLPCIRFQVISRPRPYTFGSVPDLSHPRVQLDGYADSAVGREALAVAMRAAFIRMARFEIAGEGIQGIRIVDERESIEMIDTNTEAYRISMDLIVDFEE